MSSAFSIRFISRLTGIRERLLRKYKQRHAHPGGRLDGHYIGEGDDMRFMSSAIPLFIEIYKEGCAKTDAGLCRGLWVWYETGQQKFAAITAFITPEAKRTSDAETGAEGGRFPLPFREREAVDGSAPPQSDGADSSGVQVRGGEVRAAQLGDLGRRVEVGAVDRIDFETHLRVDARGGSRSGEPAPAPRSRRVLSPDSHGADLEPTGDRRPESDVPDEWTLDD